MELNLLKTRPLFSAFEIIIERDLDLKTFYAQHQIQTASIDSSASLGESSEYDEYTEILRIVADAGGILVVLVVTFYTLNMILTLRCYYKFAAKR